MPAAPLLDIRHLLVEFDGKAVVHGIDFKINTGEILALVGESGSGKSVTASAIMGLLPSAGNLAEGEVIHLSSGTAWARVGQQSLAPLGRGLSAVFQDPMSSLNPSMHVGWQIAEPLLVHTGASKNEAQKTAIQLIKEVELPDPETTFAKYPHELSGGQKQRVMIALALAAQPELLIADEPTTALDATVQKSILALLLKLQRQRQLSVLFITFFDCFHYKFFGISPNMFISRTTFPCLCLIKDFCYITKISINFVRSTSRTIVGQTFWKTFF